MREGVGDGWWVSTGTPCSRRHGTPRHDAWQADWALFLAASSRGQTLLLRREVPRLGSGPQEEVTFPPPLWRGKEKFRSATGRLEGCWLLFDSEASLALGWQEGWRTQSRGAKLFSSPREDFSALPRHVPESGGGCGVAALQISAVLKSLQAPGNFPKEAVCSEPCGRGESEQNPEFQRRCRKRGRKATK